VTYRQSWGDHRVFYHNESGCLCSVPASWTSLAAVDPYVDVSSGRSYFRMEDLLEMTRLLRSWSGGSGPNTREGGAEEGL